MVLGFVPEVNNRAPIIEYRVVISDLPASADSPVATYHLKNYRYRYIIQHEQIEHLYTVMLQRFLRQEGSLLMKLSSEVFLHQLVSDEAAVCHRNGWCKDVVDFRLTLADVHINNGTLCVYDHTCPKHL